MQLHTFLSTKKPDLIAIIVGISYPLTDFLSTTTVAGVSGPLQLSIFFSTMTQDNLLSGFQSFLLTLRQDFHYFYYSLLLPHSSIFLILGDSLMSLIIFLHQICTWGQKTMPVTSTKFFLISQLYIIQLSWPCIPPLSSDKHLLIWIRQH